MVRAQDGFLVELRLESKLNFFCLALFFKPLLSKKNFFFYLFLNNLFFSKLTFSKKKYNKNLVRGVKGPKKSFNKFALNRFFLFCGLNRGAIAVKSMLNYLIYFNYFNIYWVFMAQTRMLTFSTFELLLFYVYLQLSSRRVQLRRFLLLRFCFTQQNRLFEHL